MTAIIPSVTAGPQAEQIMSRTVVLELLIKTPSFRASIPAASIMDENDTADPAAFGVSKALIDRKALADIRTSRNTFLNWLRARAVPCGPLAAGMHLIPLRLIEEVDERTEAFVAERATLVEKLLADYDLLVSEAQVRLGAHFQSSDYAPAEALRGAFGVRARWLSLNVPAALEQVNAALYERERARVKMQWTAAFDEAQQALREGFAGLVGKLAERLAPDADGKPKTFQSSTVDNLSAFLEMFNDRNITNDEQLQAMVRQAKALLDGADPLTLRKQETTRERVLQGFTEIEAQLTALGVTAHTRRFTFNDDEV